jgi:hypothetical protein
MHRVRPFIWQILWVYETLVDGVPELPGVPFVVIPDYLLLHCIRLKIREIGDDHTLYDG